MTLTQGYVIVSKESGERWGGLYDTIGGAKNSFNSVQRKKHWSETKFLFDEQDEYIIKPLVILEV